ncbi:MAG: twin-arginine translocase TatA/TatE family subunit [Candidatus Eremiobacteraeota bacterium]|nr:twin-arginine translocase TatA/TatE family subunit [Candidatus Eremiobacteraeota bacterium]
MIEPLIAIIDAPIIIGIVVVGALLFGGIEKLPKLARSAGMAKKEFVMGQIEADEATAKAREEMRVRTATANSDVMNNVETGSAGQAVPPPTPGAGTGSL